MSLPERYALRPMTEADLPQVLAWRNSERVRQCMFTDRAITWEEHRAWWERTHASSSASHRIFEQDGMPVGVVNFTEVDRVSGTCEWGFYVGPADAPRGSGTRMGVLALDHAFGPLGVRKVCARVLGANAVSHAYHRKLGFVEEGRLQRQVRRNHAFEDVLLYALFAEDWTQARSRLAHAYLGEGEVST